MIVPKLKTKAYFLLESCTFRYSLKTVLSQSNFEEYFEYELQIIQSSILIIFFLTQFISTKVLF